MAADRSEAHGRRLKGHKNALLVAVTAGWDWTGLDVTSGLRPNSRQPLYVACSIVACCMLARGLSCSTRPRTPAPSACRSAPYRAHGRARSRRRRPAPMQRPTSVSSSVRDCAPPPKGAGNGNSYGNSDGGSGGLAALQVRRCAWPWRMCLRCACRRPGRVGIGRLVAARAVPGGWPSHVLSKSCGGLLATLTALSQSDGQNTADAECIKPPRVPVLGGVGVLGVLIMGCGPTAGLG